MSEHTPTPWRVEQGTDLIWGACNPDDISSYGMGYSIVQGRSSSWGERKPDMAEREANAAFIVKCVNSHDTLVKALQAIAGWRSVNLSGEYEHGLRDVIRSVVDCATTALETIKESQ